MTPLTSRHNIAFYQVSCGGAFLFYAFLLCNFAFLLGACSVLDSSRGSFESPQEAVYELEDAIAAHDTEKLKRLFGEDGDYLFSTGDAVQDKNRAEQFTQLFKQKHILERQADGTFLLLVGPKEWPFPVPLVQRTKDLQKGNQYKKRVWYFDVKAGKEEIIARRVGKNELAVLSIAGQVFVAQRIYASEDRKGDGTKEYAYAFISEPGTQNGLYWPAENSEQPSPLGHLLAKAADEDYVLDSKNKEPSPFHGYYFRLLKRAPSADIEESEGLTVAGRYWFFAYPALYGQSGVMSFLMNEQGRGYERDLGEVSSAEMAEKISRQTVTLENGWKLVR